MKYELTHRDAITFSVRLDRETMARLSQIAVAADRAGVRRQSGLPLSRSEIIRLAILDLYLTSVAMPLSRNEEIEAINRLSDNRLA